jgi:hypothetical protein
MRGRGPDALVPALGFDHVRGRWPIFDRTPDPRHPDSMLAVS